MSSWLLLEGRRSLFSLDSRDNDPVLGWRSIGRPCISPPSEPEPAPSRPSPIARRTELLLWDIGEGLWLVAASAASLTEISCPSCPVAGTGRPPAAMTSHVLQILTKFRPCHKQQRYDELPTVRSTYNSQGPARPPYTHPPCTHPPTLHPPTHVPGLASSYSHPSRTRCISHGPPS